MTRRLAPRISLALALAAMLVVVFAPGTTGAPGLLLPDLVSDKPERPELVSATDGGVSRLLLRFDGFIHNPGQGAAEIRGSARNGDRMTSVVQRLYSPSGQPRDEPSPAQVIFETDDDHNHWHLKHAARYSLWNEARSGQVAPAMKVGFCLEDSERRHAHGPRRAYYSDGAVRFCRSGEPRATSVYMGTSAGWRDIYHRGLAFQWVDVSDVQPGPYWLRADVDPDNVIRESDESNAAAYADSPSVIPGHVARPVGASAGAGTVAIALAAASFGNPGPRQFRIERGPAQGTLDVPVGQWTSASAVRYTPNPGATGGDSFEYSARDANSPFPRTPARAAALVQLPEPPGESVEISGVPGELKVGASVQLTAATRKATGDVVWSVQGDAGGNSRVGTISSSGLYRAPAEVPDDPVVRIRAALPTAADEVSLRIVPPPRLAPFPEPRPGPGGGGTGGGGSGGGSGGGGSGRPQSRPRPAALPMPRLARSGRTFYVYVRPNRAGRVSVLALRGRRRVVSCRTVRVPAKRRHTCRLKVPKRVTLGQVQVVVELKVGRKVVGKRRMQLAPRRAGPRAAHHGHGGRHRHR